MPALILFFIAAIFADLPLRFLSLSSHFYFAFARFALPFTSSFIRLLPLYAI